uniref:LigA n=1 Tax=Parastrongyloides trichosuri TaxID=131310 RepID=A0A0N5A0A9_PARTI
MSGRRFLRSDVAGPLERGPDDLTARLIFPSHANRSRHERHRHRSEAQGTRRRRARTVQGSGRQLRPLSEDARLSLERARAGVLQPAQPAGRAVPRDLGRAGRHRRAHPRPGRAGPAERRGLRQSDLDQGRRPREGFRSHAQGVGQGPRRGHRHRSRRARRRRRGRGRSLGRPDDAAPGRPRKGRLDAALQPRRPIAADGSPGRLTER